MFVHLEAVFGNDSVSIRAPLTPAIRFNFGK